MFRIFVIEDAAGIAGPVNAWLMDCDFEARDGRGSVIFTHDIAKAKVFRDMMEVHKYWTTISKCNPIRPDGKPNRPLTAYTIEIVREK